MTETTLVVPAEHIELFTLGAVKEIQEDVDILDGQGKKLLDATERDDQGWADICRIDMAGSYSFLAGAAELFACIHRDVVPGESLSVAGDPSVLFHVVATMARIIPMRLASVLDPDPIEGDTVAGVRALTASLDWALAQVGPLEEASLAQGNAEHEAVTV